MLWDAESISHDDNERIEHGATTADKLGILIDILCRKPETAYYSFVNCLYSVHVDLYNIIMDIHLEKVRGKSFVFDTSWYTII